MADEIDRQNVIRVFFDAADGLWHARLGPDDGGIEAIGMTPWYAFDLLRYRALADGWIFDPSWRPASPTA